MAQLSFCSVTLVLLVAHTQVTSVSSTTTSPGTILASTTTRKGEDTFTGTCDVAALKQSSKSKRALSKKYACGEKCPIARYGQEIYDECCAACKAHGQKGEEYFGMCPGCGEYSSTPEQIGAYATKDIGGSSAGSGGARLLLESKTYTAECSAGLSDEDTAPPVEVKQWPCAPCKSVPINHEKCCADCYKEAESVTRDPRKPDQTAVFWVCQTCSRFINIEASVTKFILDAVNKPLPPEAANAACRIAESSMLLAMGCVLMNIAM